METHSLANSSFSIEGCVVRDATREDLAEILAIEQRVHFSPWSEAIFARTLSSGKKISVVVWAEQIIAYGVLSIVVDEAELLNLSVAEAFQGRGVGKFLLTHVLQALSETAVQIFLEVRESNLAAIALYETLGFCELDRRANYYPAKNGKEDALIFALMFTPDAFFKPS